MQDEYLTSSEINDSYIFAGTNNARYCNINDEHIMVLYTMTSGKGFDKIERFKIKR